MQYKTPVLCKVMVDPQNVGAINRRYPFALVGMADGMYIGDFTLPEAIEARREFGAHIRPLTRDEKAKVWGY